MRKETSRKLLTTSLAFLSLFAFSCSNMINDMKAMSELKKPAEKPEEPKEFSEIWIEKIETEDFEISDSVPGKGFFLFDEESVTDENGNIHNKSWYKRNRVNIGFDPDGGFWPLKNPDGSDASADIKWDLHKYGEEIRVPAVKRTPTSDDPTEWLIFKTGYGFNGWEEAVIGEASFELIPRTVCPAMDNGSELIFKAKWEANADTQYRVNYWLQKIEDDSYGLWKTDFFTGTTGERTNVTAPEIQGFVQTGIIQNKIIEGEGSTKIDISYNRKIITLTFKTGNEKATWIDGTGDDIIISGKYGAAIDSSLIKDLIHEDSNFKFSGWNKEGGELPAVFPLEDAEFTAVWANPYKNYKVTHYFQNTALSGYDINDELTVTKTGTIGNYTNAVPVDVKGFTALSFEQKKLTDDSESNDIAIYYNRSKVKISLNPGSGKWEDGSRETKEISATYGVPVSGYPEFAEIEGLKFTNWINSSGTETELPATGPSENMFLTATWERTIANYTIVHWFQKTNLGTNKETDYTSDESQNKYPSGTIGQNTVVTADDFTGFVTPAAENIEINPIAADNSTVINLYYNRKAVTITMKADGGKWADETAEDKSVTAYYGVQITYPENPTKTEDEKNFALTGWKVNDTDTILTSLPQKADSEDITYTAQWALSTATYRVVHYFQNTALDAYPSENAITETFEGATGAYTTASAKTIEGFAAKAFDQVKISDNNTTVSIFYDRIPVTITFDADGGKWADESTEPKVLDSHFGIPLTYPADPVLEHFEFTAWDTPNLITVPANDLTIKALWNQVDASYTVNHMRQNKTLNGYELDSSETLYGTIGEDTNATSKTISGFTAQTFTNKTIAADNSTTVEIKYNRNPVTITIKAGEGKWDDDSTTDKTISSYYGVTIPATDIPANPTREHYVFAGWKYSTNAGDHTVPTLPSSGPQESRTYTARWTQAEALYTVKHLFEKADGSGYESDISYPDEVFYGALNTMTNVAAKAVTGFDVEPIENKKITTTPVTVEIKYARKEYTVSFDPNGGYWKENKKYESISLKQKFGSTYNIPASETFERLDYTFKGWKTDSGVVPDGTVPTADVIFKAQWDYGGSHYYVVHKFQTLEDSESYVEIPSIIQEEKDGVLMETTAAEAKDVPGFTAKPIHQLTISAGGLTTVEVLYDRNDITLTFKANGGKFSDGNIAYSKTGKYGASTEDLFPSSPVNEDSLKYFSGWKDSSGTVVVNLPSTFPSSGETYEAYWIDIPSSEINGVGTYTNNDMTVTYLFGSDTLSFTVLHELSDLELTFLEIGGKPVSVSGITVSQTSENGKTKYTFSVPFTKGAGTYGLTLEMSNAKLTYTLPHVVMTKN